VSAVHLKSVGRKPRRFGSLLLSIRHPHAPGLSHSCGSVPENHQPNLPSMRDQPS
jgi:hypothetical protein